MCLCNSSINNFFFNHSVHEPGDQFWLFFVAGPHPITLNIMTGERLVDLHVAKKVLQMYNRDDSCKEYEMEEGGETFLGAFQRKIYDKFMVNATCAPPDIATFFPPDMSIKV